MRSSQEAGSAMPPTSTGSEALAGAPPSQARTPQLCQEAHPAGARMTPQRTTQRASGSSAAQASPEGGSGVDTPPTVTAPGAGRFSQEDKPNQVLSQANCTDTPGWAVQPPETRSSRDGTC